MAVRLCGVRCVVTDAVSGCAVEARRSSRRRQREQFLLSLDFYVLLWKCRGITPLSSERRLSGM